MSYHSLNSVVGFCFFFFICFVFLRGTSLLVGGGAQKITQKTSTTMDRAGRLVRLGNDRSPKKTFYEERKIGKR